MRGIFFTIALSLVTSSCVHTNPVIEMSTPQDTQHYELADIKCLGPISKGLGVIKFSDNASRRIEELTGKSVGSYLQIKVCGVKISSSIVLEKISGKRLAFGWSKPDALTCFPKAIFKDDCQ